jgi:hypothetical protein
VGNIGHGPSSNFIIFIIPYRIIGSSSRRVAGLPFIRRPSAHGPFAVHPRAQESQLSGQVFRRSPVVAPHPTADHGTAPHATCKPPPLPLLSPAFALRSTLGASARRRSAALPRPFFLSLSHSAHRVHR